MSASQPLPDATELIASASWRAIDFISDLHLGADTPRTFAAFAEYLERTRADAVLILGDLFEVWVGDDSRRGEFEAQCADLLAQAARRRAIGFMVGNRDFLVGSAMLRDCGMFALADPTLLDAFGERVLLTHGDALCLDDTDYQRFRQEVRRAEWQRDFLARPLEERGAIARQLRDASERRKRERPASEWADVDSNAAGRCLRRARASILIHGHTHRPGSGPIGEGSWRHVLSDWDLEHAPVRAEVLRLSAAGIERLSPAQA